MYSPNVIINMLVTIILLYCQKVRGCGWKFVMSLHVVYAAAYYIIIVYIHGHRVIKHRTVHNSLTVAVMNLMQSMREIDA